MISVIIPCYQERDYISSFLDQLKSFEMCEDTEFLLVDGGSNDGTREVINDKIQFFSNLRIIENPWQIVPIAMNLGIREARGEYIIRLDVHSKYPPDYLSKLTYWARKTGADNVGGICIPGALENTPTANAICKVFKDRFGVGNSLFRLGVTTPTEVDTVQFGCYRRDVFEKIGLFDERLARVQDYELNNRLRSAGGRILLVPEIKYIYYPRSNYISLWQNRYATGKGIVMALYYTGSFRTINIRHTVPLLFVILLLLPLFLAVLWPVCLIPSIFVFLFYVGILTLRSFKLADKQSSAWRVALSFFIMHFSYGLGSIAGLFRVFFRVALGNRKKDKMLCYSKSINK